MAKSSAATTEEQALDDGGEGTEVQTPAARRGALRQLEQDEQQEIYEWINDLGGTGEVRVELYRKSPTMHKRTKVDGHLQTYDGPIELSEIADSHGGGKFLLRVKVKRTSGKGAGTWKIASSRTLDIAGHPKLDNLQSEEDEDAPSGPWAPAAAGQGPFPFPMPAAPPVPDHMGRVMDMAHTMANEAREELREMRSVASRNGADPHLLSTIDSLQQTMQTLQSQIASKDQRILELLSTPSDHHTEDKLHEQLRQASADHAARIAELRTAHESELRQSRDFARDDLKRREDRFDREMDRVTKSHDRDIDNLKESHRAALDAQRQSFETRIDALKDNITRAERELSEARSELAALRARKDVSIGDQLKTIASLRESMDSVWPSASGSDEPESKWERALSTVLGSPTLQRLAGRVSGEDETAQPPDDRVAVRQKDGSVVRLPRSYIEAMQQQQQTAATAAPTASGEPKTGAAKARATARDLRLSRADVSRAVQLLEHAYRNGHAPKTVALTARNMVPTNILAFLRSQGVDAFLSELAQIKA